MKKLAKRAWKALMRTAIRNYTGNSSLYISNERHNLPDGKYFSQFGQDVYVADVVFQGKTDGVFVDIGANHPTKWNNTYLLERLGWKGVAVEPQDHLNGMWPASRCTPCIRCVVGSGASEVNFIQGSPEEHGLSGVEGFNKVRGLDAVRSVIRQRGLKDILDEFKISRVDYLSIDVEGYEMNVLESIDFNAVDIRLIGVENDLGFKGVPIIGKRMGFELGNNEMRKYLNTRGYQHIARIVSDDFFLKVQ